MDKISELITSLWVLRDWIISFINFLYNALITILTTIWNAFLTIFDWQLFETITSVVDYLWLYIWTKGAYMLIWLFCLVFLLLLVSFVMRFFRGQISYRLTLFKHHHLFKD